MDLFDHFISVGHPSARMLKRRDMDLYGIIHFGLNTFSGREWGRGDESPETFNPSEFDAEQIVSGCRDGGLKGLIFVCKHHDGFCLWPTGTTSYNITKSPFRNGKGDLVREISDACRKFGLKFGVYVSPWDRNSGAYGTPEYVKIFQEQIREVLSNYGPIFEMWFDGANGGDGYYGGANNKRSIDSARYYEWDKTWQIVRELQPDAAIFSDIGPEMRWAGNEKGYLNPECRCSITLSLPPGVQGTPSPGHVDASILGVGQPDGRYWLQPECDFPLRLGWFFHAEENDSLRSISTLLDIYLHSIGCGGTINLGIAPDPRGLLHENDVQRLKEFKTAIDTLFSERCFEGTFECTSKMSEVKFSTPLTFNLLDMKEQIEFGERILSYEFQLCNDGKWETVLTGKSIGVRRLKRFKNSMRADAVRLLIKDSAATVRPVSFCLYLIPDFLFGSDDECFQTIKARKNYRKCELIERDGATLIFDLGILSKMKGFIYFPDTEHENGIPTHYKLETGTDRFTWSVIFENNEFSNIRANPIPQQVLFPAVQTARYLRFTVLETLGGFSEMACSELGVLIQE